MREKSETDFADFEETAHHIEFHLEGREKPLTVYRQRLHPDDVELFDHVAAGSVRRPLRFRSAHTGLQTTIHLMEVTATRAVHYKKRVEEEEDS